MFRSNKVIERKSEKSYHTGFCSSTPAPVDGYLTLKFIPLINCDDLHS